MPTRGRAWASLWVRCGVPSRWRTSTETHSHTPTMAPTQQQPGQAALAGVLPGHAHIGHVGGENPFVAEVVDVHGSTLLDAQCATSAEVGAGPL